MTLLSKFLKHNSPHTSDWPKWAQWSRPHCELCESIVESKQLDKLVLLQYNTRCMITDWWWHPHPHTKSGLRSEMHPSSAVNLTRQNIFKPIHPSPIYTNNWILHPPWANSWYISLRSHRARVQLDKGEQNHTHDSAINLQLTWASQNSVWWHSDSH